MATTYAKISLLFQERPTSQLLFPQREWQVNDYESQAPCSLLFSVDLIYTTNYCSSPHSFALLRPAHVTKTSLNFLRGLTCVVIGVASSPFQTHCLAPIQDGRVNPECHVERQCSGWLSCSRDPRSTDRDVGFGRIARGEESHYRT